MPSSGTINITKAADTDENIYALALATDSEKAFAWGNPTWASETKDGTTTYTATLTSEKGGWYGEGTNKLTYGAAEAEGKTFTISSTKFDTNAFSENEGKITEDNITFTHGTAIIGGNVLGAADATVGGTANLSVELASAVSRIGVGTNNQLVTEGWSSDNSGFTYALAHGSSSEGYQIDNKTLKYYPDETNAKLFSLTGLAEGTEVDTGVNVTQDEASGLYTVELFQSVLPTELSEAPAKTTRPLYSSSTKTLRIITRQRRGETTSLTLRSIGTKVTKSTVTPLLSRPTNVRQNPSSCRVSAIML